MTVVAFASEIIVLFLYFLLSGLGTWGKQVGMKLEVRIPFSFWLYFFLLETKLFWGLFFSLLFFFY